MDNLGCLLVAASRRSRDMSQSRRERSGSCREQGKKKNLKLRQNPSRPCEVFYSRHDLEKIEALASRASAPRVSTFALRVSCGGKINWDTDLLARASHDFSRRDQDKQRIGLGVWELSFCFVLFYFFFLGRLCIMCIKMWKFFDFVHVESISCSLIHGFCWL